MRFLLHQSIVPKMFLVEAFLNTEHYYSRRVWYILCSFFIKGNNCSYKQRYKRYLKLICKCLS